MNLKERLALRKVATYRISHFERRYLKRHMNACKAIIDGAETKINYLPEMVNFYAGDCPGHKGQPKKDYGFRAPMTWYTFNTIIVSLHTAWREIHPYPFEENDIVYPGKYVDQLDELSARILSLSQMAVSFFGMDKTIDHAAHVIFDKEEEIPPLYISHFEIMIKYLKRYVKDHAFDSLCLFTPRSLQLAKQLIDYEESTRNAGPTVPLKTESEDSL